MSDADVIVVGAGLAGLTAACELHRRGRGVIVLERSDGVGGRVRTDSVDGYLLDRGFQVLLTAYPSARQVLDIDALDLASFEPGAMVWHAGGFQLLSDPWRRPSDLPATLRARVGTPLDKLRVLRWRGQVRRGTVDDLFDGLDETVAFRLRRRHFSPAMVESFFRPLLAGITLEPDLSASAHVAEFVLRMLSEGDAAVPAAGMGEIPRQLAARLPAGAIRFDAEVERVGPGEVGVGGETLRADRVVVATDVTTASEWVDGLEHPGWAGVTTLWFGSEEAPTSASRIILNGEPGGVVTDVAVISNVAPSYAPYGHSLIGVSLPATGVPDVERRVRHELAEWWPGDESLSSPVRDWDLLRVDEIAHALPRQLPGFDPRGALRWGDLVVAGDHRRTASIDGAIRSGLDAAAAIIGTGTAEPAGHHPGRSGTG